MKGTLAVFLVAFGALSGVAQAQEAGPSNLTPAQALALLEQDGIPVTADSLNRVMLVGPEILEAEQSTRTGNGGGGNHGGNGNGGDW